MARVSYILFSEYFFSSSYMQPLSNKINENPKAIFPSDLEKLPSHWTEPDKGISGFFVLFCFLIFLKHFSFLVFLCFFTY